MTRPGDRDSVAIFVLRSLSSVDLGFWLCFFFSSRRRHTILVSDWSSDVCSSDLRESFPAIQIAGRLPPLCHRSRLSQQVHLDCFLLFFSSRRRHTRYWRDWSSDVCSSD